jgi:eukaryotic-like serine/threonine-protein kinase
MILLANMHISHYSISSQLSAGGMGKVYRARDPRLNRDVAIKILPASFASDEERLRRIGVNLRWLGGLASPKTAGVIQLVPTTRASR